MRRQLVSAPVSPPATRIPPGTITIWPTGTIPKGWLICDGSYYLQADYPALYGVIAGTFGASGSTFGVPALHGRVPYGVSAFRPLNTQNLSTTTTHLLSAAESALRNHTHGYNDYYNDAQVASCNAASGAGSNANQTTASESTNSVSASASSAHNNLQPYLLVNFIIKT
jgi:microcystin-dependent protein